MQNLKYLEEIKKNEKSFSIVLKPVAMKHDKNSQINIACTLLEFFNNGKYVDKRDITQDKDTFFVSVDKYPHLKKANYPA